MYANGIHFVVLYPRRLGLLTERRDERLVWQVERFSEHARRSNDNVQPTTRRESDCGLEGGNLVRPGVDIRNYELNSASVREARVNALVCDSYFRPCCCSCKANSRPRSA